MLIDSSLKTTYHKLEPAKHEVKKRFTNSLKAFSKSSIEKKQNLQKDIDKIKQTLARAKESQKADSTHTKIAPKKNSITR
ncbi:MAG: hypothetical protein RCG15_01585 [Candidatus Rickettsia vulgarisii]